MNDPNQVLAKIYHATQGETVALFVEQCFAQLQQFCGFDQAWWQCIHQHNQQAFAQYTFGSVSNEKDKWATPVAPRFAPCLSPDNDQPQPISGDALSHAYLYTVTINEVHHGLQFNWQHPVSEDTLAQLKWLSKPIANAYHQCLLAKMSRHWHYLNSHKAWYDRFGNIIQAQESYTSALSASGPPQSFSDIDFANEVLPKKYDCNDGKKIEVGQSQGLYLAQLYQPDELIEALTPTEKKVARILLQSHSAQAIADTLKISKRTAEQHVNNIRQKLEVDTTQEILMVLIHSDYCFNGEVFVSR